MADGGQLLVGIDAVAHSRERTPCRLSADEERQLGVLLCRKKERKRGDRRKGKRGIRAAAQVQRRSIWGSHNAVPEQLHVLGCGGWRHTRADQSARKLWRYDQFHQVRARV